MFYLTSTQVVHKMRFEKWRSLKGGSSMSDAVIVRVVEVHTSVAQLPDVLKALGQHRSDVVVSGATAKQAPTPGKHAIEVTVADRVRRVRNHCSDVLWGKIQAIARSYHDGEQLNLHDWSERTGRHIRKVHSTWNSFGKPLASEPGPAIFEWVKGTKPKAFTLSREAREAILESPVSGT